MHSVVSVPPDSTGKDFENQVSCLELQQDEKIAIEPCKTNKSCFHVRFGRHFNHSNHNSSSAVMVTTRHRTFPRPLWPSSPSSSSWWPPSRAPPPVFSSPPVRSEPVYRKTAACPGTPKPSCKLCGQFNNKQSMITRPTCKR